MKTKSIWADFSMKYSCHRFMFGRVDVIDLDTHILKKYNINNEGFNRTLPIIILFEKDKEIIRFPPYEEKGLKKIKYDKKILKYNKVIYHRVFLLSNYYI